MRFLLLRWLINAASLLLVARIIPDFRIEGCLSAMIAAVVVGFVNATLGVVLRFFAFPLTLLTLGLFLIVVDAVLLKAAAAITPGFEVKTWKAALVGALLLAVISTVLNWFLL
ncbi:MAG TPA: phage holin family protein [Candidatus Angelobacter sp.]|nr:phage holin family protein [Candidatus Angelobacter sp.]